VRLAHLAERSLEQLAVDADAAGDHGAAVRCWRRLTALDPLKTRVAVRLISALAARGERSEALRHADEYARRVREELDAEPSAAVTSLADRLRADAGFTVGPGVAGEGEVGIVEVPAASRVAALRFRGPYAELERAYGWLYGEWLPGSGEEPADRPGLEEYVNDPRTTPPPELLTDIMLPLRERATAAV
jgi:hypothetical protein